MRPFFLAVVVGLSACTPTAGGACSEMADSSACNSGNTVLWCDGGKWVQYDCPGPQGCYTQMGETYVGICNFIGSKAGERCPSHNFDGLISKTLFFCADAKTKRTCVVNNGAGVWTDTACADTCPSGCN